MKSILTICILLISISCGHNRLQFVKANKSKKDVSVVQNPSPNIVDTESQSTNSSEDHFHKLIIENEDAVFTDDALELSKNPERKKMTKDGPEEKEQRKKEKLVVRHATISTEMFIAGSFASLLLTAIFGLPLFFVGLFFFTKAKRGAAQTDQSVAQLKRARIWMIVNIVLAVAITLFILLFLGLI